MRSRSTNRPKHHLRNHLRSLALVGLATSLGAGLGCGSDTTGPSSGRMKEGYWALQLDQHAITLSLTAPSNKLQLHAAPLTVHGDTIPTTAKVQYTSSDSSVLVDSTGLLTARLTNVGVNIVAQLTVTNESGQPVTLADTAMVNVNVPPAPLPVFTAFQITTPGDSATFSAVAGMAGMTVTALDASNTPLTSDNAYNVFCRSSNRDVVNFGRGFFRLPNASSGDFVPGNYAYLPGNTMITCSATIYGVRQTDSISVRIGMPVYGKLTVDAVPLVSGDTNVLVSTAVVKIGVGGIIQWDNKSGHMVDLVFDDSLAPQSVPTLARTIGSGILNVPCRIAARCHLPSPAGNVQLQPATSALFTNGIGRDFRRFPVAGTYPYHSTAYPTVTGTIVVQ